MKTPLVIIIVIVVAILGFLLVYSQQRDVPVQATKQTGQAVMASPVQQVATDQSQPSAAVNK